jgi:hypothetical protein
MSIGQGSNMSARIGQPFYSVYILNAIPDDEDVASLRKTPTTKNQVTCLRQACESMNLIKDGAVAALKFIPKPPAIPTDDRTTITVLADHKGISKDARSPDMDALAAIVPEVHECNHGDNSFLNFTLLQPANAYAMK